MTDEQNMGDDAPKTTLERRYIEAFARFAADVADSNEIRELTRLEDSIGKKRARQLEQWFLMQGGGLLVYSAEGCDIIDIPVPQAIWDAYHSEEEMDLGLDDGRVSQIKQEILEAQLLVTGIIGRQCSELGMIAPVTWSWTDSQANVLCKFQSPDSRDAEVHSNAFFDAWLGAVLGKAPIYVNLKDSAGKDKSYRVQFGEPRAD